MAKQRVARAMAGESTRAEVVERIGGRSRLGRELHYGDATRTGLVDHVHGHAVAGPGDDAGRQLIEHHIVSLERGRLVVAVPVRLERNLSDAPVIGPARCDALAALGR